MNERKTGIFVFLILIIILVVGTAIAGAIVLDLPVKEWLTPFEPVSSDPNTAVVIMDDAPVFENGVMVSPVRSAGDLLDSVYAFPVYSEDADNGSAHMQGACTDGTWLYVGWSKPFLLMKINLFTKEIHRMFFSEQDWPFGHINDMTYNPNTNKLYICAYHPDEPESGGTIAVVDPVTLQLERKLRLMQEGSAMAFHGIAYDRLHRCYILAARSGGGRNYYVLDDEFNYLRTITTERTENYLIQGIETDGSNIYRCLWNDYTSNHIAVYDMDGNFLKLMDFPVSGRETELEDICYDWKGSWYVNTADYHDGIAGCTFYYVGLQPRVDYTQAETLFRWMEKEISRQAKEDKPDRIFDAGWISP